MDFGLFDGRLTGTAEFYLKKTTDLLNQVDQSAGSNFTNKIVANVGSMENRGVELTLSLDVIKKKDLTWNVTVNGAYNKNNPGKLKLINTQHPVRVYPVSYVFQSTDVIFRDAVNAALDEMILDGTMDKIFNKIDIYPHAFYRATISYKDPASTP